MPFYQILCIAAHNPEYVREEAFSIHTLPYHLGLHSGKSKASSAWRPPTYKTTAVSFAEFSTWALTRFLNACDHMERIMITESAFCHPLLPF